MAASQRIYYLVQDFNSFPTFGLDDGTAFYGIKPYNKFTVSNANRDGSAANLAEMGTKDNDMYQISSLANAYYSPTPANQSTVQTITFATTIKQLLVDNSAGTVPCYVEYNSSVTATTGSPQVVAGGKELFPVYTSTISLLSSQATSVVIRGWA